MGVRAGLAIVEDGAGMLLLGVIREIVRPGAEVRVGEGAREGGGRTCFFLAFKRISRKSCANWNPGTTGFSLVPSLGHHHPNRYLLVT